MRAIEDLKKKLKDVKDEMQRTGKAAIKEAFAEFFDSHPEVSAIRWEQFTPYFNDGDVCKFGVGEMNYRLRGATGNEGDLEDGFIYPSTHEWNDETRESEKIADPARLKLVEDILAFRSAVIVDDVFEAVFGDHAQVTATRRGFTVEEYEHD